MKDLFFTSISEEEIQEVTEEAKGPSKEQCFYYITIGCGWGSNCDEILRLCGYPGGVGVGGCWTCTCR